MDTFNWDNRSKAFALVSLEPLFLVIDNPEGADAPPLLPLLPTTEIPANLFSRLIPDDSEVAGVLDIDTDFGRLFPDAAPDP